MVRILRYPIVSQDQRQIPANPLPARSQQNPRYIDRYIDRHIHRYIPRYMHRYMHRYKQMNMILEAMSGPSGIQDKTDRVLCWDNPFLEAPGP